MLIIRMRRVLVWKCFEITKINFQWPTYYLNFYLDEIRSVSNFSGRGNCKVKGDYVFN